MSDDLTPDELQQLVLIQGERLNVLSQQLATVAGFMDRTNKVFAMLGQRIELLEARLDARQLREGGDAQN